MTDLESTTTDASAENGTEGWEWAFVEVMGHRSHWGRAREVERFGIKMLRVDVPVDGDPTKGWETHLYTGSALFSYTLTDRETALARNKPYERPSALRLAAPSHGDDVSDWADDGQDDEEAHHGS